MRIIGGEFRGRNLRAGRGGMTRPTLSRIREALFNILQERLEQAVWADFYAGTGSIGLEALSRGAKSIAFIEWEKSALRFLEKNVMLLDPDRERSRIIARDAHEGFRLLRRENFQGDILFFDPPYEEEIYQAWRKVKLASILAPAGIVVVQHARRQTLPKLWGGCARFRERSYGNTTLAFYQHLEEPSHDHSQA
jgi:16S rRNA (guanine(966)-N(2))-methyltransferase RsmD